MPNWVYNTMTVSGDEADVKAFHKQGSTAYTSKYMQLGRGVVRMIEEEVETQFSFWNFVRPDDSILGDYWGEEPRKATLAEALKFDSNHWYDWNIRNWGCKWDAKLQEVDESGLDKGHVAYVFETAWGQPQEFFEAVVKQFPHLDFTLDYEEEQGWGGEIYASKGVLDFHKKWDIPELIDVVAGL